MTIHVSLEVNSVQFFLPFEDEDEKSIMFGYSEGV